MRRIAVYGGTFDPPHMGHIRLIQEAAVRYDLVLVCPNRSNWQKGPSLFSHEERGGLLREVLSDSNVEVCDYPYHLTLDLLMELRVRYPEDHLTLLVGADVRIDGFVGVDKIREIADSEVCVRSELSSTLIRQALQRGDLQYCEQNLHPKTYQALSQRFGTQDK